MTPTRTPTRNPGRERRRQSLLDASVEVFSRKGVAATSVEDIVRAAGVAKGTFYLYFATKDDAVTAVAQALVENVSDRIEAVAGDPTRSPVERLLAFGGAVSQVGGEAYERDLVAAFHRPENRALHDRLGEEAISRLAPAMTGIIEDGIASGVFRPQDARRAAAWVMACFGALHEVITDPGDVQGAIAELDVFVLRGLGFDGPVPA